MKTIDVQTLAGTLTEVVELAHRESGVVLTLSGRPVARVLPISTPVSERTSPLHPGAMVATDDFDAPLPDDFWLGKE